MSSLLWTPAAAPYHPPLVGIISWPEGQLWKLNSYSYCRAPPHCCIWLNEGIWGGSRNRRNHFSLDIRPAVCNASVPAGTENKQLWVLNYPPPRHITCTAPPEPIRPSQRILAPKWEVWTKPRPSPFQVLVYMDTVVQKTTGSALVTEGRSLLESHISSTASCSPFSCCTMQPTLLLKRRDRLPFWELLPWVDLSFFKRRLFLLHIPRMSQILSVPSWEAV